MSARGDLLEGTLALIKPDAVHKYREILNRIEDEGFLIVEIKSFNMSRAMARKFYQRAQHRKDSPPDFYRELLDYMTSGNIIAMCLARKDGVQKWTEVMGPKKVSAMRVLMSDNTYMKNLTLEDALRVYRTCVLLLA